MATVAVLGGGISGLSAAHFLKAQAKKTGRPLRVRVVEARPRLGGWVQTQRCGKFLFETGPHSLRVSEAAVSTLRLIQQLKLDDEMIQGPSLEGWIYTGDKIAKFETHLSPWRFLGVAASILRESFVPPTKAEDETVYDWSVRRFGRYITERGVDPLISGIYAGNIKELSAKSCLAKYWAQEHQYGSLVRASMRKYSESAALKKEILRAKKHGVPAKMTPLEAALAPFASMALQPGGLFSFRHGLSTLTDTLVKELTADDADFAVLENPIRTLQFGENVVQMELQKGEKIEAQHVVSALPTYALAELLRPHDDRLGALLAEIKYTDMAVVNFGYDQAVGLPPAFGYLVPTIEKKDVLGVVFDSTTFPFHNPNKTVVTVMMGGENHRALLDKSPEELVDIATEHMSYLDVTPAVTNFNLWRRALPQYNLGHSKRVQEIEAIVKEKFPRLRLIGNAYHGVGVNDCVALAERTSESLVSALPEQRGTAP